MCPFRENGGNSQGVLWAQSGYFLTGQSQLSCFRADGCTGCVPTACRPAHSHAVTGLVRIPPDEALSIAQRQAWIDGAYVV
jgi:hypothetical protein